MKLEDMKLMQMITPLFLVLCCAGCMSPDIGVLDLKSGKMLHPPYSMSRQIVVGVNREAQTFTTLVREKTNLVMRTFDRSCQRLSEHKLPLLTRSYCDTSWCAASDDAKSFVFATDRPADLVLLDVPSGQQSVLQKHFTDSWGEMPVLKWLNPSTLLTVLREYPGSSRATNEIALFDIASRKKTILFNPVSPSSFDYALSSDRRLLAFRDGNSKHAIDGVIKIVNLHSGATVAKLGDGKHLIHEPVWSPDDTELAYVEGKCLNIWNRDKNTIRTIKTFPDGWFVCYHVIMGDGIIGYIGSAETASPSKPLVILDSKTGREIRSITAEFKGQLIRLDQNTIVCGLGY